MKFLSQDGLAYLWTKIQAKLDALASRITTDETAIAGKVDKVEGKGLSTEDYTSAEKTKLAGVEAGANAYTLPAASAGTIGGVKQGTNVSIAADGTLSATDTTYGEATTGSAGLMSAADKTKLDGVATGANAYVLPKAAADTLGGIKVGNNLSIDGNGALSATATPYTLPIAGSDTLGGVKISGGNLSIDSSTGMLSATDTTYSPAVASSSGVGGSDGLMTAGDKEKLNGIAAGANAYVLPEATDQVRGGVLMDYFLNQNSDNPLANSTIFRELDAIESTIRIGGLTVYTDHFSGDADKNFFACDYYGNAIIHLDRKGTTGSQLTSVNISALPNGMKWASSKIVSVSGSDGQTYYLHTEQGHGSITLKASDSGSPSFNANFSFTYTGIADVTY